MAICPIREKYRLPPKFMLFAYRTTKTLFLNLGESKATVFQNRPLT